MPRSARPPLSPEAAAVVRALSATGRSSGGRLSRRGLLSGAGALGVGAALAACGTKASGGASGDAKPTPATDVSDTDKQVKWANWTLYLDKDDKSKKYPTLEEFSKKTGIKASYFEEIEDNDSYYGKIQAQLRQGQDIGRDVIVLTDWMAGRLVKAGWTQKLDKANIPNAANILDKLKDVDYDQGRNYSLTWQSGYTGLAWNTERLKTATKGKKTELKSLDDLWDPALKGRVSVLSEMRDTIGLIMLSQGADPSKPFGQDAFDHAMQVLEKQISSGQIRQVKGNSYKEDLTSGDAIAVIAWSGDIFQLNAEAAAADANVKEDPFVFRMPDSGGMLWSDNLLIPIGATHKTNAEILMNYYYDPQVAAEVANYVQYICPVKGAREALLKLPDTDHSLADSPFVFPAEEDLAKAHTFRTLSATEETEFVKNFQNVLGS